MLTLEEWLRRVGFSGSNPFARKQADEEGSDLQAYFVEHPAYNALRETGVPRSVILHAPRGAGKSTARRMFEDYCAYNANDLRPLMISLIDWTWATEAAQPIEQIKLHDHLEELFRRLVVALAQQLDRPFVKLPDDEDVLGYARWLCSNYAKYLLPAARRRLAQRGLLLTTDLSGYNLFDLPLLERLGVLMAIMREMGFNTCFIMLDCIDEFVASGSWTAGAQLLVPIIGNLPMLETPGLVFRCFIPSEVFDVLVGRDLVRQDRFQCVPLDWSDENGQELLLDILRNRLLVFSNGEVPSLASLAPELRDLDERLVAASGYSPRQLLDLGDRLFRVCASSATDDDLLISIDHLERVLRQIDSPQSRSQSSEPTSALERTPADGAAVLSLQAQSQTVDPESLSERIPADGAAIPLQDRSQPSESVLSSEQPSPDITSVPLLQLKADGSIWRGATPIDGWQDLPGLQRQLLRYLYDRRGEMCLKTEIIAHIWREYDLSDDSSLRKLAERLIRFIEPIPDQPVYIEKIRGGHYLLRNTVD